MDRPFSHTITYGLNGPASVTDVASSLIANERLVFEALIALEEVLPGLTVEASRLYFKRASTDSPLQEMIEGIIILSFQPDMAKHIPDIIYKLTGEKLSPEMSVTLTIIVIALASFGMFWAAENLTTRKKPEEKLTINGNYNQIIQVGRDVIGDGSLLGAAVRQRYSSRGRAASLARRSLELIGPAKREPGSSIEGGGARISPEAILASPSLSELDSVEEEMQEPYPDQLVDIHATDLDSNKSGWAGVLPGLWEKRIKMRLYPTIKPEEIFGKRQVRADVILVSKLTSNGDYMPYIFHVVKIYE